MTVYEQKVIIFHQKIKANCKLKIKRLKNATRTKRR